MFESGAHHWVLPPDPERESSGKEIVVEQRRRILILDVDENALIALERILENAGFDTTTTWDVVEGQRLLESGNFDLLLLGDHPPELDPESILQNMAPQFRSRLCLILSSSTRVLEIIHIPSFGDVKVLPKSRLDEVVDHVTSSLGYRGPGQALVNDWQL